MSEFELQNIKLLDLPYFSLIILLPTWLTLEVQKTTPLRCILISHCYAVILQMFQPWLWISLWVSSLFLSPQVCAFLFMSLTWLNHYISVLMRLKICFYADTSNKYLFICFTIWHSLYISVFALRCYQCKYKYNSSCKQNLTKCPLQCGSITIRNSKHCMI